MADFSKILRLLGAAPKVLDLTTNTLLMKSLKVGADTTPSELTVSILNNLINLQNGTDFSNGVNSHTHDGRYYTQTILSTTTSGSSGAHVIGMDYKVYDNLPGYETLGANTLANYNAQKLFDAMNTALAPPSLQIYDEPMQVIPSGSPTNNQLVLPGSFPAIIDLPLDSRTALSLRQYIVGAGQLQVWLNGQYLTMGVDWNEVGTPTTLSNQIQIINPLSAAGDGDDLEFRIAFFITIANNVYEEPITFIASGSPTNNQMVLPGSFPATIALPLDSRNLFGVRTYKVGSGSLQLWLNGQRMTLGVDWAELGSFGSDSSSFQLITPALVGNILVPRIGE